MRTVWILLLNLLLSTIAVLVTSSAFLLDHFFSFDSPTGLRSLAGS